MKSAREPIDIFYMKIAYLYAGQSTCVRRHVGSVIVKNGVQIGGGYNGAVEGAEHCTEDTCLRKGLKSGENIDHCKAAHSEQNAITQAAKLGIAILDTTIYCTTQPCTYCAKMIANSGIKRLVYCEDYGNGMDDLTKEILHHVEVVKLNKKDVFKNNMIY